MWRAPPNWPQPPPGWYPPTWWEPPADWPPAPPNWQFWGFEGPPRPVFFPTAPPTPTTKRVEVHIDEPTRNDLKWEVRWVMFAFLVPAVGSAIVPLVEHAEGVNDIDRFAAFVRGQPLVNMILGIVIYLGVGSTVPLVLWLLRRTGDTAASLGLGWPSWGLDIWPGVGLSALSFVTEIGVLIPLAPVIAHSRLVNQPVIGHVPSYYVFYGLVISAVTAITEEVLVNGYLLVRLEQLGWTPQRALMLSLLLRTSYHVYYGIAVFLVIPFGYFVTRSFQKHRRLTRPIAAHFIYDAVLITISVLVH